jgi:hypothetical protein
VTRRLRVLLACECSGRVRDEFARRNWEAWSADLLPSETPVQGTFHEFSFGVPRIHGPERLGLKNNFHYQGPVQDLFSWDHPVNAMRRTDSLSTRNPSNGLPLWDLIIAFPPCTDLSYAGSRWFKEKLLDGRQDSAADLFMEMVNAPAPHVAVENPRGVMFTRYRKPDQTIQPWWFGDAFRKNTCLWLKNLPLLEPEFTEPEVLATVTSGDAAGYALHRVTTGGGSSRTDKNTAIPSHNFNGRKHYEDSEGRKNRAKVRSRTFPGIARAFADQWGSFVENAMEEA